MSVYDRLVAAWTSPAQPPAGASGTPLAAGMTTQQKIDAVNGWTLAKNVDVEVAGVAGRLMLASNGAYLLLEAFAQSTASGEPLHDAALSAAKLLIRLFENPNAPKTFAMSEPATFAAVKQMLDVLFEQEAASANSTGITQAMHDQLLTLCSVDVPWVTSPAGGGLADFINANDAALAGVN